MIKLFFMSYLPLLNRAFGCGLFGKWLKIFIGDQNKIFSLLLFGKPDREKNESRGFWKQILCFDLSDCAPTGWLAHQYNFKTFMAGLLFMLHAIEKDFLLFKVINYFGTILYLLLSHTALQGQMV